MYICDFLEGLKISEMSEVNKSLGTNPVLRNYVYRKRESQECENNANSRSGSEELECTTDRVREQDKDTAFCVISETPDNTDEEELVNQDQQQTVCGYETVIVN